MPLFGGNKFSPKKGSPRKYPSMSNLNLDATERSLEAAPISLKLGSQEIVFDEGQWIPESMGGAASSKEVARIKKQYQQVVEENNLLKYKVELLLDMLSERTAESHFQDNEIDQLKKELSSNKSKRR